MNAQTSQSSHLALWIINMPAILFCVGGLAIALGWLPASIAVSRDFSPRGHPTTAMAPPLLAVERAAPAHKKVLDKARTRKPCVGCGAIVSMRAIEVPDDESVSAASGTETARHMGNAQPGATMTHEITVRLADGSIRVIHDANPASWRLGERLIIVDGAGPSRR